MRRHWLALLALLATGARAAPTHCADLASLTLPGLTAITAVAVPAGDYVPEDKALPLPGLPAFCRVHLVLEPAIGVELWLPDEPQWNGRLQGTGTVAFGGFYIWAELAEALAHGFAGAQTDAGHVGRSGDFVLRADGTIDEAAIRRFADDAAHAMTVAAKQVVARYYGRPAHHAYFWGCSLGGFQALIEAERHSEDYDGILAGSPAISPDRFLTASLWPQVVMNQEVGHAIDEAKLIATTKAAVAACAAETHEPDGILADPRRCGFDPHRLVCRGDGGDPATCLTAAEAGAVAKIWAGPRDADGRQVWWGLERDAILAGPAVMGTLAAGPVPPVPLDFVVYWLHRDRTWDWRGLTESGLLADLAVAKSRFGALLGNDDPDLSALGRAGHKLIVWHGWSDHLAFARAVTSYGEAAVRRLGPAASDTMRLFIAPGTDHCFGGTGPDSFGGSPFQQPAPYDPDHHLMAALVAWVEAGRAPDGVVATKFVRDQPKNGVAGQRRLCPYPAASTVAADPAAEPPQCPRH